MDYSHHLANLPMLHAELTRLLASREWERAEEIADDIVERMVRVGQWIGNERRKGT